jgi:hypothetical protein
MTMCHRLCAFLVLLLCLISAPAKSAHVGKHQVLHRISARELVRAPARYINKTIQILAVYCFFNDTVYNCVGTLPLQIVSARMIPTKLAKLIKRRCGGIDVVELSSLCRMNVRFVPRAVSRKIGEYTSNGRSVSGQITEIETLELFATR